VSGDVAGRVRFDEEVEVALVIVGGDGGVGADDFFAFDGGCERDVLADGQTEDVFLVGELESVAGRMLAEKRYEKLSEDVHGGVVRENGLFLQLEILELIRLEHLPRASVIELPSSQEQRESGGVW